MKSILCALVFTVAIIGCDTPENSSGNEISEPPINTADSAVITPEKQDTVITTPVDTTGSIPPVPTDSTMIE